MLCDFCKDRYHPCRRCKSALDCCSRCEKVKHKEFFSSSMWHNHADTTRKIICLQCEAKPSGLKCDICKVTKPTKEFSTSAQRNHTSTTQKTRCYDCSHPPCMFLPKCTTCTKCRRTTCRDRNCSKEIETLHPSKLPGTFEDVHNYACLRCAYVRCVVKQADGTRCGKERRHNARANAKRNQEEYKCGKCETWWSSLATLRDAKNM